MKKYYSKPTDINPEIILSPEENLFLIKGDSRPEDVREIYRPVVNWLNDYCNVLSLDSSAYSKDNPFTLQFDLEYFNSSSAKFLYDIVMILKKMKKEGVPVLIKWSYDPADIDSKEAGEDLALLAEIEFVYLKRQD